MVTPPILGHPRVGGGCCGRTQAEVRERERVREKEREDVGSEVVLS